MRRPTAWLAAAAVIGEATGGAFDVVPDWRHEVHSVWPNGPSHSGKLGGPWPQFGGRGSPLVLRGAGSFCVRENSGMLWLDTCKTYGEGLLLVVNNATGALATTDGREVCIKAGQQASEGSSMELSNNCDARELDFSPSGTIKHVASSLCLAPMSSADFGWNSPGTELVLSSDCASWVFEFWDTLLAPPGSSDGFIKSGSARAELSNGNYRWSFPLDPSETEYWPGRLPVQNLVAYRVSDGEEFPHTLYLVLHTMWGNNRMYLFPASSGAEFNSSWTAEFNAFFPAGTQFRFKASSDVCDPSRVGYTGYRGDKPESGQYCQPSNGVLDEEPDLAIYSGNVGLVLDAKGPSVISKLGSTAHLSFPNNRVSSEQVYGQLADARLTLAANVSCRGSLPERLYLEPSGTFVDLGLVRQGHTVTQVVVSGLRWRSNLTGEPFLFIESNCIEREQDPTDLDCASDYGQNNWACKSADYPYCVGHVPGSRWGKCFDRLGTCKAPEFWLDVNVWGDAISMQFAWEEVLPTGCSGTVQLRLDGAGLHSGTLERFADLLSADRRIDVVLSTLSSGAPTLTAEPPSFQIAVSSNAATVLSRQGPQDVIVEVPKGTPTCSYTSNCGNKLTLVDVRATNPDPQNSQSLRLSVSRGFPTNVAGFRAQSQSNSGAEITGLNVMFWDAGTNRPAGIPSHISKNWHAGSNANYWAGYDGQWWTSNALIRLPANYSVDLVVAIMYEEYGGIPAFSHAQLSIVGYSNKWLWEEAALGTGGENFCMDPLQSHTRASITDVRVKLFDGAWKENVGGGDYLLYYGQSGAFEYQTGLDAQLLANGPCLSNATYSSVSVDKAIKSDIQVSGGRTDDLVRIFIHARYTALHNTSFSRLAFFHMGAETYNFHSTFSKFVIGDGSSVLVDTPRTCSGQSVYQAPESGLFRKEMLGQGPWWFALSPNTDPRSISTTNNVVGDRGLIVRSFHARLDGQVYEKPTFSILCDKVELGPHASVSKLQEGDFVDIRLEMLVLPRQWTGEFDFAKANSPLSNSLEYLSKFNTTWERVQAHALNNLDVTTLTPGASVESHYPVRVCVPNDGSQEHVRFQVRGSAVGFVPIVICGLSSPELPQDNGLWTRPFGHPEFSLLANETQYRQANYIRSLGQYELVFNVEILTPQNFTEFSFGPKPTLSPSSSPTSLPSASPSNGPITGAPSRSPSSTPVSSPTLRAEESSAFSNPAVVTGAAAGGAVLLLAAVAAVFFKSARMVRKGVDTAENTVVTKVDIE